MVGHIPASRRENFAATLAGKISGESQGPSVRCSYVGVFTERTPHVFLLRNGARTDVAAAPQIVAFA